MRRKRVATNVADLREEPGSDGSEPRRCSQLLFNEEVEVLDGDSDWSLVEGGDGYAGWVRKVYLGDFQLEGKVAVVKSLFAPVMGEEGRPLTKFSFGTVISGKPAEGYLRFRLPGGSRARVDRDHIRAVNNGVPSRNFGDLALSFVGIPYLWGGTSSFGFDCSGFVQRLYGYLGTELPRDTDQQLSEGRRVGPSKLENFEGELRQGDLIFFEGHVGIYLAGGRMIHSSRRENGVAVTDLTREGAYLRELRESFVGVRRVAEIH